jgi:hypothetical protein
LRPSRFYAHVRTQDWFAVAIDFLIVVLGVYVAVWANNQQLARQQEQRTGKVVAALRRDLRDTIAVDQKFEEALAPAFAGFKAARERSETPPPVFLRISGSDTPPRSPCLGVFQAEIAELLDPMLLWEICFYYDERDGLAQKFVRYTVFTENEILPRLKEDPRIFYTEDRKRLAPAFDSHMDRLQEWRRDTRTFRPGDALTHVGRTFIRLQMSESLTPLALES